MNFVIARSEATKQSPTLTLPRLRGREGRGQLDCFASLAMTNQRLHERGSGAAIQGRRSNRVGSP
jgi:hypothetical protein